MKKTVEETYQKLTDREQILLNPDMYIGSYKPKTQDEFVYNDGSIVDSLEKITSITGKFCDGFYKIFDEIIVNAIDNAVRQDERDKKYRCTQIVVDIDRETGEISVENDGNGIPVVKHKVAKTWVPSFLFSDFKTSSNYSEKNKIVGGKNGFGAKLTNVFSKLFTIEVGDPENRKYFKQVFKNNMDYVGEPIIEDYDDMAFTKITYLSDFEKFGMTKIDNLHYCLLVRRCYDLAFCCKKLTNSNVIVFLNKKPIELRQPSLYCSMYYSSALFCKTILLRKDWHCGLVLDPRNGGIVISFVNSVCTKEGGTHVDYVLKQLTKEIKKKTNSTIISLSFIRNNFHLFLDINLPDPEFGGQAKNKLEKSVTQAEYPIQLDSNMIEAFLKGGLSAVIEEDERANAELKLKKTLPKANKGRIYDIEKLDDAEYAGIPKYRNELRLFLVEGKSARSFVWSGWDILGSRRAYYGIYSLRGKFTNIDTEKAKLFKNQEFIDLTRILGLEYGKDYSSPTEHTRYGGVIILTDQDDDGNHIKGLIMNFFSLWPGLLARKGFIQTVNTPLIKITKGKGKNKVVIPFYSFNDFGRWTNKNDITSWKIKYYKGLGTSDNAESKEIMKSLPERIVSFVDARVEKTEDEMSACSTPTIRSTSKRIRVSRKRNGHDTLNNCKLLSDQTKEAISLAFNKQRADDRKDWLSKFDPESYTDYTKREIYFHDFINKDLIRFSMADNIRSIPNVCDGNKRCQRKCLYVYLITRGLAEEERKLSDMVGLISSTTNYHHGEASLVETLARMSYNCPGSNNINLFTPSGQFGTRAVRTPAQPRYINTLLSSIAKFIFRDEDKPIYKYVNEDNKQLEPSIIPPIFPFSLANPRHGIGTGFYTETPPFDPLELSRVTKRKIKSPDYYADLYPWYFGFKGDIVKKVKKVAGKETNHFLITCEKHIKIKGCSVFITEIPVMYETTTYFNELIKRLKEGERPEDGYPKILASDLFNRGAANTVNIEVVFYEDALQEIMKSRDYKKVLVKMLNLSTSISLSNMVFFDEMEKIKRYETIDEIINDFMRYRHKVYIERKEYVLRTLENNMLILKYKVKFLSACVNEEIKIRSLTKQQVIDILEKESYPKLNSDVASKNVSYSYITEINLFSITTSEMEKLINKYNDVKDEYSRYLKLTVEDIWLSEIDEFEEHYKIWEKEKHEYIFA